ncbi:MAG: biotin/lipoyl-containing protein, partial [Verrucomicrobiota bacterium]
MTIEVKVPASGESITSANVALWHKKHGDFVRKGELLATLETDKVSNELEAPTDGTLAILISEGEEVPIGTVIARIEEGTAAPVAAVTTTAPAAPPVVAAPAPPAAVAPVSIPPAAPATVAIVKP